MGARLIAQEAGRFAKYVVAGLVATGTHYVVMVILVSRFALPEVVASSIGFIAGACVKYPLNYWAVFASGERHAAAIPKFVLSLAIGFVLNAVLFAILLRALDVHYMVSQVLTTGLVLFVNYLLARWWVFAVRGRKEAA
jgi:putative flippase GtrA